MADFVQLDGTVLYIGAGATQANARVAFLLFSTPPQPPGSISLDDSLNQSKGAYLLFPALPQDAAKLGAFITKAQTFVNAPGRQGTRFVWFPSTTGQLNGQILRLKPDLTTADRVDFEFQNYTL